MDAGKYALIFMISEFFDGNLMYLVPMDKICISEVEQMLKDIPYEELKSMPLSVREQRSDWKEKWNELLSTCRRLKIGESLQPEDTARIVYVNSFADC